MRLPSSSALLRGRGQASKPAHARSLTHFFEERRFKQQELGCERKSLALRRTRLGPRLDANPLWLSTAQAVPPSNSVFALLLKIMAGLQGVRPEDSAL